MNAFQDAITRFAQLTVELHGQIPEQLPHGERGQYDEQIDALHAELGEHRNNTLNMVVSDWPREIISAAIRAYDAATSTNPLMAPKDPEKRAENVRAHYAQRAAVVRQVNNWLLNTDLADPGNPWNPTLQLNDDGEIEIRTPYNADFVTAVKGVDGRRWDGYDKCWTVPGESRQSVIDLIRQHYG